MLKLTQQLLEAKGQEISLGSVICSYLPDPVAEYHTQILADYVITQRYMDGLDDPLPLNFLIAMGEEHDRGRIWLDTCVSVEGLRYTFRLNLASVLWHRCFTTWGGDALPFDIWSPSLLHRTLWGILLGFVRNMDIAVGIVQTDPDNWIASCQGWGFLLGQTQYLKGTFVYRHLQFEERDTMPLWSMLIVRFLQTRRDIPADHWLVSRFRYLLRTILDIAPPSSTDVILRSGTRVPLPDLVEQEPFLHVLLDTL